MSCPVQSSFQVGARKELRWVSGKVPTFKTFSRNQCLHSYFSLLICQIRNIEVARVRGRLQKFAVLLFVIAVAIIFIKDKEYSFPGLLVT